MRCTAEILSCIGHTLRALLQQIQFLATLHRQLMGPTDLRGGRRCPLAQLLQVGAGYMTGNRTICFPALFTNYRGESSKNGYYYKRYQRFTLIIKLLRLFSTLSSYSSFPFTLIDLW